MSFHFLIAYIQNPPTFYMHGKTTIKLYVELNPRSPYKKNESQRERKIFSLNFLYIKKTTTMSYVKPKYKKS